MRLHRFEIDALPATPWKNGGGTTREVLSWPPGAGIDDFDWRVSIATIAAAGPFSTFAGVDRIITLLDGDGVRLVSPDFDHMLTRPLEPFAFSGDLAVDCSLPGGASTDFNVMGRRATGSVCLEVLHKPRHWAAIPAGLLLSVRGIWHCNRDMIADGQGLWWADRPRDWMLAPATEGAVLIAVSRTPA